MIRNLRLDEFSPRATEPLPPHVELTHGPDGTLQSGWVWCSLCERHESTCKCITPALITAKPKFVSVGAYVAELAPQEQDAAIAYLEGEAARGAKGRGR